MTYSGKWKFVRDVLHVACRVAVMLIYFSVVVLDTRKEPHIDALYIGDHHLDVTDNAMNALLIIIGIWVLFGIFTRVITVLGDVLFVSHFYLIDGGQMFSFNPWLVLGVLAVVSAPLLAFGGGRFSMLRKGWSLPI